MSVTNVVVEQENRKINLDVFSRKQSAFSRKANLSKQKAICREAACLVKTRPIITLKTIVKIPQLHKDVSIESEKGFKQTSFEDRIHRRLRSNGLRPFLRLLQEYFQSESTNVDEAFHKTF